MAGRPLRYPSIAEDITRRINKGDFDGYERLPTTRDFTYYYRCSSRTILKAWDSLKADGIIYTRPGKGTYIKKRSN